MVINCLPVSFSSSSKIHSNPWALFISVAVEGDPVFVPSLGVSSRTEGEEIFGITRELSSSVRRCSWFKLFERGELHPFEIEGISKLSRKF